MSIPTPTPTLPPFLDPIPTAHDDGSISNRRAFFSPRDNSAHTFDVLTGHRRNSHFACLIAYVMPGTYTEWKVFLEVSPKSSAADAVHQLDAELQGRLDSVMGGATVNDS
jgi:hypothetical protein